MQKDRLFLEKKMSLPIPPFPMNCLAVPPPPPPPAAAAAAAAAAADRRPEWVEPRGERTDLKMKETSLIDS